MYNAYLIPERNEVVITKSKVGGVFLCSKERSIARIHWSMLKPFKLSNGNYMMSDRLLMCVAKIFNKNYEDLWNIINFCDQIDLKDPRTFVVCTKQTDEGWLSDLGILGDQLIK